MVIDWNTIIYYIFLSASFLQLIILWVLYGRFALSKIKIKSKEDFPPISVVIVAHNEEYNFPKHLPKILEQDYPEYEVLVVNDQSDDDSDLYLKSLQSKYPHLKHINVSSPVNFFKGKKFPLSIGIKSAKNELLVLTDADCTPVSDQWLKNIAREYDANTEIVLGYGAYQKKSGILNYLIRTETLFTAQKYFSMAKMGMAYMGVGRNLSYKKSLFFAQKGFQSHYKIPSGDDDLFVNAAANKTNVGLAIGPDSRTLSIPETKFSDWIKQKRRHFQTGKRYKKRHLFILGIIDTSYLLFVISALFMAFQQINPIILSIIVAIRYISFGLILKKSMLKLGESKLLLISPLLELVLSIVLPIIAMTNIFTKESKWK